ncbi:MAG: ATP-sensitive inward rectifier potassium channel 10 [Candidatus Sericytochromatia bacterium]|nr:ATP-sensitive inward rectifier potassium channel 10 [Candidatus Sericytochromatia bacterium]
MARKIETHKTYSVLDKNGRPQYPILGLKREVFSDLYHHFIRKSWMLVILAILAIFVSVNIIFTFLYMGCGDGITNAKTFSDYFFFSVQTLSTIGYGFMYPTNICSHSLVAVQSFLSILFVSSLTGIVFAKFSVPRAKIIFTKNAVVTHQGQDIYFKFRMSNTRANQILDAKLKVVLLKNEIQADGSGFRRIYDMNVLRDQIPIFSLSFTVQHLIDEKSPFFKETHESLVKKQAIIIITISGIDDTLSQTMVSRYIYDFQDIVWGADFKDVLLKDIEGNPYFDYKNFHILK